jgi:hypothetical protein
MRDTTRKVVIHENFIDRIAGVQAKNKMRLKNDAGTRLCFGYAVPQNHTASVAPGLQPVQKGD